MSGELRVEQVVTSGVFTLDGQSFDVDNNVWLVGDDDEVVVVDAAHDATAVAVAVGGRRVPVIVATHGHNDHIDAAVELASALSAPVALHPDDRMLWDVVHPGRAPDRDLADGDVIDVGGARLEVLHTPGHSPGGVCLHAPGASTVFSGDTLFAGGPGATGRSHSDFPTILASIESRLLGLPPETVVRTGHGPTTTIGDEAPSLGEWRQRGH